MPNTLGQTRIEAFDALTDEQLYKNVELSGKLNRPDAFSELYTYAMDNRPDVYSRITAAANLEVPLEQVDVESGMGFKMRAMLSFLPLERDRINVAEKMVNDPASTMKAVDTGNGKRELFYQHPEFNDGRYTKVDEQGFGVGDIADILGEAPRTGAAVGAGIATAPFGPAVMASASTLASTLTGMAQDAIIRFSADEEVNPAEIAIRRGIQGVAEGAIDYLSLKTLGGASRLLKSGVKAAPADVAEATQRLHRAYNEVDAKFNTQLDRTAGVRSGEVKIGKDLAERESIVAGSVPDGMLARRLSRVRDQIGDMTRALKGEGTVSFGEAYQALRQHVLSDYNQLVKSAKEASVQTKQYVKSAISSRLDSLGYKPGMSLSDAGKELRSALSRVQSSKSQINKKKWSAVDRNMDADGVVFKSQDVANRLNKITRSSSMPKNEQGDVLEEFLTPQMKEMGRQASGLEDPTMLDIMDAFVKNAGGVNKPTPLSYGTLREWRSRIGQRIDWDDHTVKTKGLRQLHASLTDMMEEGKKFASPDTLKSLADADTYFKKNVLPFREGQLAKVLERPIQDYTVGNEDVLGSLLNLTEVRRLKSQLGSGHETIQGLRQAYLEKLTGKASNTYDGRLNSAALSDPTIDRELAKELFGANGTRALYELGQLGKLKALGDNVATLKPDTVKRLFEARTPADVKKIAKSAKAEMKAHEAAKKYKDQALINDIIEGKIAPPDATLLVESLMSSGAKPVDVRRIMGMVGKDEQSAIRQEFFSRMLNKADMGASKSTRMSVRRDKGMLWDTDKMTKMLRDPKQRRVMESVLGKEDVTVLENLNLVLHSVRSDFDKGVSMLSGRPIISAGKDGKTSMVYIATEIPRAVYHRVLSAMYGGGHLNKIGWTRLLSDTKEARKFFKDALPAVMSSERGLKALAEEGNKDPRVSAWVMNKLDESNTTGPARDPQPIPAP